jgi:ribonuclease Z
MISTLGLMGRKRPLHIYAPHPFGEILDYHTRYFDSELPYEVVWHEVDTRKHQLLMESGGLEVWSIPLRHRVPCAGFHFKEKPAGLNVHKEAIERYGLGIAQITSAKRGEDVVLDGGEVVPNGELTYTPYEPRSYAYLSDTNYSAKAVGLVKGVDLLYHEATYGAALHREAKERGHSSTLDAAKAAVQSGAQRLLIGHFSSRYKDLEPLLTECREIFPATDIARERETFSIEPKRQRL